MNRRLGHEPQSLTAPQVRRAFPSEINLGAVV
jgi:hypothetical protein